MNQMSKASVAAIPCHKKEYGVGYTQVIESLPYSIPILLTDNKDIPLNVEKHQIGFLIAPYDVEKWIYHIKRLKDDKNLVKQLGINAQQLMKAEYNAQQTYKLIKEDLYAIYKKKHSITS